MFLITTMAKTFNFAGPSATIVAGPRSFIEFSSLSGSLIMTLMSNVHQNSAFPTISY